jgi:hypothetical protein
MRKDAAGPERPRKRDRVRNWREYNGGLIARGDLTVWPSQDLAWHAQEGTGKRGRPRVLGDTAIGCALTLKVLFQLPLRAAQGLVGSPIRLAGLAWPVPHDSTLSRRQRDMTVAIPCRCRGEPLHLVVDSTGVKVPGEGEWKVRRHGAERRRVWRKVHLAIDAGSHDIRALEMTDHRHGDAAYEAAAARNAALLVPPRRNGKPWKTRTGGADERNETLRAVRHLGRRLWKRWSGYHSRSLVETAMSHPKRLGERLAAHDPARQVAEVQIRCAILNTTNRLGMPDTVAIA